MFYAAIFVSGLLGAFVGVIAGWWLTCWGLKAKECDRCGQMVPFQAIQYGRCCGEAVVALEL